MSDQRKGTPARGDITLEHDVKTDDLESDSGK